MRKIRIGYLYGSLMNLYGDRGNILTIVKRCQWREITAEVKAIEVGDRVQPGDFDLYFFGGGQDQSQDAVSEDLRRGTGKALVSEVERGVPLLSICGGYQLLGRYYQPHEGPRIPGVGLFDAYTVAGDKRLVGNLSLVLEQELAKEIGAPPTLIGFENHSGKTYLGSGVKPLGIVLQGNGNNGEDGTEGAVYKSAIGCYLHGSLLPKNPHLADWLIKKALQASKQDSELPNLHNDIEMNAHRAGLLRAKQ